MATRHWIIILSLCMVGTLMGSVLAPTATPVHAQNDNVQPIFYLRDGDIWRYDPATGALVAETNWGYNEHPQLSYDGQYFAYNSIAAQVVNSLGNEAGFFGDTYSNIWMAVANNQNDDDYVRIAQQPTNMIPPTSTNAGAGIIRSTPSWSRRTLEVTWLEYDTTVAPAVTRLVVYNVLTNSQRIIRTGLSLGFQDGGLYLPEPKFGDGVISHTYYNAPDPNSAFAGFTQVIEFYDAANGTLLDSYTNNAEIAPIYDFVWLADMADTVALLRGGGEFETYNIRTRSSFTVQNGALVGAISLARPDNFNAQLLTQYNEQIFQNNWTGRTSNGQAVAFNTPRVDRAVAVSPSGDGFAYLDQNGALWVTRNGQLQIVPGSAATGQFANVAYGPIWGGTGYHIKTEVGTHDLMTCFTAPTPRLSGGASAVVIPNVGGANVLRGAPGTGPGSAELIHIPENGVVTILGGPYCSSGYYWYLVNYGGQLGYTAEGSLDGVYWLRPS